MIRPDELEETDNDSVTEDAQKTVSAARQETDAARENAVEGFKPIGGSIVGVEDESKDASADEQAEEFKPIHGNIVDSSFATDRMRNIGFGEKLRKGMESETGENYTTAEAVGSYVTPFVGRSQKMAADIKTRALEQLNDQTALDDIKALSPNEYVKSIAGDNNAENETGTFLANRGFSNNEEMYERGKNLQIDSIIKDAGLADSDYVKSKEFQALSADEKLAAIKPLAEQELYRQTATKQAARETLSNTHQGTWSKIGTGAIENTGYTLEYVVGSMLGGGMGFMLPAAAAMAERYEDLRTNDYAIENGKLVNKGGAYSNDDAYWRAAVGGAAEAGVEMALGKTVGLLGKGALWSVGKIPGATKYLIDPVTTAIRATKGAIHKVPGVKAMSWLGKQYDKVGKITQFGEWPEELAEEDVQALIDDIGGLGRKANEQDYGWEDYRRDTLNWNNQRDILLGMLGTMVFQGAVGAGVGAHQQNKIDKFYAGLKDANGMAGFTSRNANEARGWLNGHGISEEDTDGLSDNQAAFVANIGRKLMSMSPSERENVVKAHGEKVAQMADRLMEQESFKYDETAMAEGRAPARFTPETNDKGQVVWRNGTRRDLDDGKQYPTQVTMDRANGVAIRDNGVQKGTGNHWYTVMDRRGNEVDLDNFDQAVHAAHLFAKGNAELDAQNKVKGQQVKQMIADMYGNSAQNKFIVAGTLNDLLDDMRGKGADENAIDKVRSHVRAQRDGGVALGNGQVALILDNIDSPNAAYELLQHEVIGHSSLANKFGGKEAVVGFLRSLDAKTMKDFTAQVLENHKQAHIRSGKDEATAVRLAAAEVTSDEGIQEVFAHMVQSRRHSPTLGQKLNHFVREVARKRGVTKAPNDADLEVLLSALEKEAAKPNASPDGIRVVESMTANGITFLKTEEAAAESAEAPTEGAPAEPTATAENANAGNYRLISDHVAANLRNSLGRTPSSSEVDSAVSRIVDAGSFDDAINAIAEMGLADDTELFNAAKSFYGESTGAAPAAQPTTTAESAPTEPTVEPTAAPATETQPTATAPVAPKAEAKPAPKPTTKFKDEASYHSKIMSQVDATEEPIESIEVDNELVPNVKKNADPVTGEVEPLKGDPIDLASNPIVVWETKSGKRVVATGRHRYWLYKRAGRKTIPARVIKESDGWTQKDVLVLDAMSNIIDKKGTVHDYYDFFGRIKPTRDQAIQDRLLDTEIGRSAFSLYADASEDLRAAVNWDEPTSFGEDRIPVELAAKIASILPVGENEMHAGAQRAVVDMALKNPKWGEKRIEMLARQLAYEAKNRGASNGKGEKYVQDDLFGADDTFMKEMAAIAEYRSKKASEYNAIASALANANAKNKKAILAIKGDAAKELGIKDINNPKDIKRARDTALAKKKYWEEGTLTPEDNKAMRDYLIKEGKIAPTKAEVAPEPEAPVEPQKPQDLPGQGDLFGGGENSLSESEKSAFEKTINDAKKDPANGEKHASDIAEMIELQGKVSFSKAFNEITGVDVSEKTKDNLKNAIYDALYDTKDIWDALGISGYGEIEDRLKDGYKVVAVDAEGVEITMRYDEGIAKAAEAWDKNTYSQENYSRPNPFPIVRAGNKVLASFPHVKSAKLVAPKSSANKPKSDKTEPKKEPSKPTKGEKPPKADKPAGEKPKTEKKPEAPKAEKKPAADEKKPAAESKPKAAPKKTIDIDIGDMEGEAGDLFGSPNLSFATPGFAASEQTVESVDSDKYPKQVAFVTKIVNRIIAQHPDQVNFKTLATMMFEQLNKYWPNIKGKLRGIWNGIADDQGYEDVSRKEAEAFYAELEGRENEQPEAPTEPAKEEPKAEPTPAPVPPSKEQPKVEPKKEPEPPVVTKPPKAPEPRKGHFTPDEAGKIAFDLGGSESDQKEVADLIGDINFASPDFAIALQEVTLANGEKAAAPVATAPRELTAEEKEHNRIVIGKLIKKLVDMGHNTFDKLVRAIAHASYKLYRAVKNTLRGHWSDAVNNGVVPEDNDVTVKQAKEVIAEVDDELADALHIEPAREDGRTQWTIKDQRDAYLAMTNREFAAKNPEAVKIANEMLEQGVPVSGFAQIKDWWTQDDAAYWPVKGLKIINAADAAALFQMLSNPYVEISKALYIDKNHRVLEGRVLGIGTRTQVMNPFAGIDENVPEGTVGIIISHNHPTGNVVPSGPVSGQRGDVQATDNAIKELNAKGLLLLDHIVTDTNHYTSMAAGVAKGVDKVYGNMKFNANAQEYWHPKLVNRGESIYDFPPLPWENVLRMDYDGTGEKLGVGYFNGQNKNSVAQFVADQLSTHNQDRSMIVMLNDDAKIVAIVRVPTAEALKKGQKLSEAISDIIANHKEMASAMVYFGHEKFDQKELALAFMQNDIRISAVYSADKGKFLGEKYDTPEYNKFKLPKAESRIPGYEDLLLGETMPQIWDKDAKGVSKRVPKALPIEILPKIQYTIQQKGGKNGYVGESGQDSSDAGGRKGGMGADGGPQNGEGGDAGGSDDREGQGHPGRGVQDSGEGSGSGMGGSEPGVPSGGRGVNQNAGEGKAGEGLYPNGNEGRERGLDDDISNGSARDSVHLQPGRAEGQVASDNFIATAKVIKAWDRVADETPASLLERAKSNMEALDVLDSLNWNDESNDVDTNISAQRLGTPQRSPTMEEKEALACFTGWYGFYKFVSNDNLAAAYNQYLTLTDELRKAGIEIDEETSLAKAAERTNNLRHLTSTENADRYNQGLTAVYTISGVDAVSADVLKAYKELKETISDKLWKKISYGEFDNVYSMNDDGAENAPAMPTKLATALLDSISNAGLKGGYFINPLAGWGREVALSGSRFATDTNWTVFEPNTEKAKILRALFPKANVFNSMYRNIVPVNSFYDMAITVAPFNTWKADAYSHLNDFVRGATQSQNDMIKMVKQLRVGGVAAIVMPMDNFESYARMIGMANGKIVGLMKIPAVMAGYSPRGWYDNERTALDKQAAVMIVQRDGTRTLNKNIEIEDLSKAFYDNRNTDAFYKSLRESLKSAMNRVNANTLSDPNSARFVQNAAAAVRKANNGHPEGEMWLDGDTLKIKELGKDKRVWISSEHGKGAQKVDRNVYSVAEIKGVPKSKVFSIFRSYDALRKAIDAVLDADARGLADANEKKNALKLAYMNFVNKHGLLHNEENMKVLSLDRLNIGRVDGIITYDNKSGIEKIIEFDTADGKKSLTEINPFAKLEKHEVPSDGADAVRMSITNRGFIDPTYIGQLLGMPVRKAMQQLLDERVVFIDPQSQRYADRSEYLSGLVRSKYEAAKKASSIDSRFLANAEELQKKLTPITSFDAGNVSDRPQVSARCGWVPVHIMRKFFRSIGIHGLEKIDYNKTAGRWIYLDDWKKVTLDNPSILRVGDNTQKSKHIRWWLNGKPAIINDENGQIDDEASEDVNNAFTELDKQLSDFIVNNNQYKAEVEKMFSEQLQDEFVERDYSGYDISLPGVSQMWWNRLTPQERFYQRRAIIGAFIGDTQLLDHNVGSGKTFEMIASVMAMKHFGKIRKPIFTGTNGTVKQIHDDWIQMFPNARLLVLDTEDLSQNGRITEELIRENDWDGIIIPHQAFKQFGMSVDFVDDIIAEQSVDYDAELAALKEAYQVADASDRADRKRTSAEKDYDKQVSEVLDAKANALRQYEEMRKDAEANRAVCFDKLGVDYLVVDEAHYFKTVEAKTSKGTIQGVVTKGDNSGLTKSMVPSCYYLNKLHGGRHGVLFATGTPLTNSFTEVYTMMNYLAPGLLRDIGCPTLDSFLNAFCNFKVEFSPKIGGGFNAETVLQLANGFPLSKLFRHVADVALAGQDYNVAGLPERLDYIVEIPQSTVQQMSTRAISELAQALKDGQKLPGITKGYLNNQLGRSVAINPYLIGVKDENNARARVQARVIKSFYEKDPSKHHVIFTDLGAPKEFEYKNMVISGNDSFQLIGKGGRLIDVGPRNPYTGYRTLTATIFYNDNLTMSGGERSVKWNYLDDVPGQSTAGASFNPAALHMALAVLERKADVMLGKIKTISQRKRGEALSTGDVKKKSKLTGDKKFDFGTALKNQIDQLGYDPRLTEITDYKQFMIPPLRNKELAKILSVGGEAALDEKLRETPMFQFYWGHTFDEYAKIIDELVAAGIPRDEIAIANNKDQVEAIKDDFDSPNGKTKVLITGQAAQEGVNFQHVLWTLHHHDIPWMPGPKGQRDGRIWRPGNINNPVHIFNYITPDSADGRSYTVVSRKAKLLYQIQTKPEHNLLEDLGSEAGSLAEMTTYAIKDKRVYWQDRLEKQLRRNRATVNGEEKRLLEFNKSINNYTNQQARQNKIVEDYRKELMPIFKKREEAKREFAITTPKGEKLTTTKEILEYLSNAARKANAPVRRTVEEFTIEDYLTWVDFHEDQDTYQNDSISVHNFLASEGISPESSLEVYYARADLVQKMHVENYLDSQSTGETVVGDFYGTPVKITTHFSNSMEENGGRKILYTADIEVCNASMAMPVNTIMKDGRPDGEAPQGSEQGLAQMKGAATRTLNPVSDARPVPKAVANAEDILLDINERLTASVKGKENAEKSLKEAQGPIDSLERKLQMLHDSFMADSNGGSQPTDDFKENLEQYMKDGDTEDDESLLYKVDGGAVLRDGVYDETRHMTKPKKSAKKDNKPPTPPEPPAGGNGGGASPSFASPNFANPSTATADRAAWTARLDAGIQVNENGIIVGDKPERITDEDVLRRVDEIVESLRNGSAEVPAYSRREIVLGTDYGGRELGALTLIARATGSISSYQDENRRIEGRPQRDGLARYARNAGIAVSAEPDKLRTFLAERGVDFNVPVKTGTLSSDVYVTPDSVIKIRRVSPHLDAGYGGATLQFDDVFLHNSLFGDRAPYKLIGYLLGDNDNTQSMILEQPRVDVSSETYHAFGGDIALGRYLNSKGIKRRDPFGLLTSTSGLWVKDVRVGNVGVNKNGHIAIIDPQVQQSTERLTSRGLSFASPGFVNGIANADQDAAQTERGLKAPQKRVRGDARVMQGAETLESNPEFMKTLRHAVAVNPRAISAEENVAMARNWLRIKDEYDDLVESHVEAINAGDEEAAKRLAREKKIKEKELAEYVKAREYGVGEAARTLRTNRFLFAKDYSLAGLAAQRTSDLGRPLTDLEFKELKEISDKLKKLDEANRDIALQRIKANADHVIQDMINAAKVDSAMTPRTDNEMRRMLRKRNEALAQIEVLAFELGGKIDTIIPDKDGEELVSGSQFVKLRRYLRGLAEYHVYHNPNITVQELMQQFADDISPYFTATSHELRQIFSGYGFSWNIDRNERERKVSDLTSQARILEQILDLDNGEMVKLTGPQRSEPSDTVRELMHIRDQKRRQMERDGQLPTGQNHLKTMLESAKTRYQHMIDDIKKALDAHAKLPEHAKSNVTDAELDALKAEYATLREEYDRIWGKTPMSDEAKRNIVIKALERALERWMKRLEDARNGKWTHEERKGLSVTGGIIDELREKIQTAAMELMELRRGREVKDISPDEIKFIVQQRLNAINRAITHWQTAMLTGEIAPKKKSFTTREFVADMERRLAAETDPAKRAALERDLADLRDSMRVEDETREQRNRLYRQILDMREHDKNKKAPLGLGYAKEYAAFVNNLMRSFLATADASAMMRQTSALTTAHLPTALKTFWKTFGTFFKGGSRIAADIDRDLKADPIVREAIDNGWLNWRNLEGDGSSNDVEMFHGVDAQAITIGKRADGTERRIALGDIPFIRGVLHGSERQYASFINMMSAEIYKKMVASPVWGPNGANDYQKRELAAYVNMANGSAQLGAKGKQAMSMLTGIFWAPKLAVSRAQLALGADILHPFFAGESSDANMKQRAGVAAYIAVEHARAFAGAVAAGFLLLCLFGDDDDKYEMSQAQTLMDKGLLAIKPRIGSTSIDFSGGVSQYWKLLRMLYTGTKKTATGKEIDLRNTYGRSLTQELFRFLQGKLNPLASNTLALMEGKDYVGNEFGIGQLALNTFVPLGGQDVVQAVANENNGVWRGLMLAPLILAGAGGSTYDTDRFKVAQNTFKARVAEYKDAMKGGNYARMNEIVGEFPELKQMGHIQALFDAAHQTEGVIKKQTKLGRPISPMLEEMLRSQQERALAAFRSVR